jgi:hypothetical protein
MNRGSDSETDVYGCGHVAGSVPSARASASAGTSGTPYALNPKLYTQHTVTGHASWRNMGVWIARSLDFSTVRYFKEHDTFRELSASVLRWEGGRHLFCCVRQRDRAHLSHWTNQNTSVHTLDFTLPRTRLFLAYFLTLKKQSRLMRSRCCPYVCVCVCIPHIAARQRLGKIPLNVAGQRLGKNLLIDTFLKYSKLR